MADFSKRELLFGVTSIESYLDLSAQDLEFGFNETRRDRILRTYVRNVYHYHLNEIYSALKVRIDVYTIHSLCIRVFVCSMGYGLCDCVNECVRVCTIFVYVCNRVCECVVSYNVVVYTRILYIRIYTLHGANKIVPLINKRLLRFFLPFSFLFCPFHLLFCFLF
jgi:hypothetical protein